MTNEEKIEALRSLGRDEEKYDEPPNERAIDKASEVLKLTESLQFPPPTYIYPTVYGGVCLAWSTQTSWADVEILNSGEILACTSPKGLDSCRPTKVWRVPTEAADDINDVLLEVQRFVNHEPNALAE